MKQIMRLSTAAAEWEVDPEDAARLVREGAVTAFVLGGTLFVKPQQFEAELLRAVTELAPQDPKLARLLEREFAPPELTPSATNAEFGLRNAESTAETSRSLHPLSL